MTVSSLASVAEMDAFLAAAGPALVVMHFWADWAEPCRQMDAALGALARRNTSVHFARVEAEAVPDASEKMKVVAVPTVLLVKSNEILSRLDGADVPTLRKLITQHAAVYATAASGTSTTNSAHVASAAQPSGSAEAETQRLKNLANACPVMLFMKGIPSAPRCGFSRQMVALLQEENIDYGSFDILSDENVRSGMKTLFDWPTFPMLFHKGELLGGLDIVKEAQKSGELNELPRIKNASEKNGSEAKETVSEGEKATDDKEGALKERLSKLVRMAPVMLFMKGVPAQPQCGFSRQMVALLAEHGVCYGAFDILSDPAVRAGLKEFSDWPTFPQLYANGELLGGLDIVKEMAQSGELEKVVEQANK